MFNKMVTPTGGNTKIDDIEVLLGNYPYGSTASFTLMKEDGTIIQDSNVVQGNILKFTNRASGGFKYTLTALAPCHVSGSIKIGSSVIGSFNGDYPTGDIQVYDSSTTSGTLTMSVIARNK